MWQFGAVYSGKFPVEWSTKAVRKKKEPFFVASNLRTYISTSKGLLRQQSRIWGYSVQMDMNYKSGTSNTHSGHYILANRCLSYNNHIYWSRSYQCLVKILSQSFPWCVPGPPLPQSVQLWCCSPRPMSKSSGIWVQFIYLKWGCFIILKKRLHFTEQEYTISLSHPLYGQGAHHKTYKP